MEQQLFLLLGCPSLPPSLRPFMLCPFWQIKINDGDKRWFLPVSAPVCEQKSLFHSSSALIRVEDAGLWHSSEPHITVSSSHLNKQKHMDVYNLLVWACVWISPAGTGVCVSGVIQELCFTTTEGLSLIHSHPLSDPGSGVSLKREREAEKGRWIKEKRLSAIPDIIQSLFAYQTPQRDFHWRNVTRGRPHNPYKEGKMTPDVFNTI